MNCERHPAINKGYDTFPDENLLWLFSLLKFKGIIFPVSAPQEEQ